MNGADQEAGAERLLALRGIAGALRARLRFHAQCGLADYPFIAPPRRKEARQEAKPAGPPQGPRTALPVPPTRPQTARPQPTPEPIVEAASPPDPDRLAEAQSAMRTCAECPLATAAIRMCGRGRAGAPLVVVGDHLAPDATADHCFGPGEDEMLWIMMGHEKTLGLGPEDVYVTNLLKCAPPPGQKPDPADAARCLPHLLAELDAVRPRLVCVMGDLATRVLLGGRAAVAHMRGRPHTLNTPGGRHILMVTYHPRFLLRAQDMKKAAMDDLLKMRELLAGRR